MTDSTAQDLIQDALEKMQVYAPGETVNDADAERALGILNNMLDSWSNESLSCYAIQEQSGALVNGQNSYTIGSGGNFNLTRPIRINDDPGSAYIKDTNGYSYPVDVVNRNQWNLIGSRLITTVTSNIPNTMFYDPQFPLGVINIFPTPNIAYTLFFDSYLPFTEFSGLTSAINLPPGYALALVDNLCAKAWRYFKNGQTPPPDILEDARQSKGTIKRANQRLLIAFYDSEIVSRARGTYNIYRDNSNAR